MMSYIPPRSFDNNQHSPPLTYPQSQQVYADGSYPGNLDEQSPIQRSYTPQLQSQSNGALPPSSWSPSQPLLNPIPSQPLVNPIYRTVSPAIVQDFSSASRHQGLLQVYSFSPRRGEPGTRVTVCAKIPSSDSPDPNRSARILFGDSHSIAERITRVQEGTMIFELRVKVPDLQTASKHIVLKAQLLNGKDEVLDSIDFGSFFYMDPAGPSMQPSTGERRFREDDGGIPTLPPSLRTRTSVPQLPHLAAHRTVSVDASLLPHPSYHGLPSTISPASALANYGPLGGDEPRVRVRSAPLNTSAEHVMWSNAPVAPPMQGHDLHGTLGQGVSLMRTTQIQGGQGLVNNQALGKVGLHLQGKLADMAVGWSQDEVKARRRLVQFDRSLEGSILKASFKKILPAEYVQGTVVVSCIYREHGNDEEKDRCYITSVDTIQLLEALIQAPFSVEEKNRIRRNLEGFKPITVSKHKPEQEDFFKLIMEFPTPKPRNIEKDVKVFRWETLEQALLKIVDKYSVMGVTDATAGLVAFAASSESPTVGPATVSNSSDESPLQPNAPHPSAQPLKTEPVEHSLSDYGSYDGGYAPGQLNMRPTSTSPDLSRASMSMSSSPYIAQGPAGSAAQPQFSQNNSVPSYYNSHMLNSAPQYTLAPLSYNDPSSSAHRANNMGGEHWADYLMDPPSTAGGTHMTSSNSQGSNHPSGVDDHDADANLRRLYAQTQTTPPNLQPSPSRAAVSNRDDGGWRGPSASPHQSVTSAAPNAMYYSQPMSTPDLGDHTHSGPTS